MEFVKAVGNAFNLSLSEFIRRVVLKFSKDTVKIVKENVKNIELEEQRAAQKSGQ